MRELDDWYRRASQAYQRQWAELGLRVAVLLLCVTSLQSLWHGPPSPRRKNGIAYSTLILTEPSGVLTYSHPESMPELEPGQEMVGIFEAMYQTNISDGLRLRDELQLSVPPTYPPERFAVLEEIARSKYALVPSDLLEEALAQYTANPGSTVLRSFKERIRVLLIGWMVVLGSIGAASLAAGWWVMRGLPPLLRLAGWVYRGRTRCVACGYPLDSFLDRCPECGSTEADFEQRWGARRALMHVLQRLPKL